MPTPTPFRRLTPLCSAACALALGLFLPAAHAARTPQPVVHLSLEDLGVPPVSQVLQASGAVLVSAHFVDAQHLLVTYGLRGLVERIPGDPPEHNDRAVAALLVELPSGKVLARARWHLHDYQRFLWPLGNGRFLMRNESRLVTIAPMRNLASGDAFHQMPFIRSTGLIEGTLISPEGDLVTVETSPIRRKLPKPGATPAPAATTPSQPPPSPAPSTDDQEDERPRGPVDFAFYRVEGEGTVEDPLIAVSSGLVKSPTVGVLPVNGRGILSAISRRRDTWTMQFSSFNGETRKLSDIPSSCPPIFQFLGLSNYLVFSCRGSADHIMASEFNFLPHEMWEEPMPGTQPFGVFAFAPAAGRFALSRLVTLTTNPSNAPVIAIGADPGTGTSQDIRVYQAESGDLLLKFTPMPFSPSGQNFDLSSDGMNFLLITNGFIDVYRLPPLSKQDREDLAALTPIEPAAPKSSFINIRQTLRHALDGSGESAAAAIVEPQPGLTVATTLPPPAPAQPTILNGDSQLPRRKPPSLLNPGEKPEFAEKKKSDPTKD